MRFSTMPVAAPLVLAACLVTGCGRSTPDPAAAAAKPMPAAGDRWASISNEFIEAYFAARPMFAVRAGRHEFDGQMPDLSRAGIAAEISRLHELRAVIAAPPDGELGDSQKFERELLGWVIDSDLFWLEEAEQPARNPAWYSEQLDPEVYLTRNYAPLATRMLAYTNYARAIPRIAQNIKENLRLPLPPVFVDYGVNAFGGYASFFRDDVPKLFTTVDDPKLQADFAAANSAAATAMSDLAAWFESQRASAGGDFALGPRLFARMLSATERLDLPLERIEAVGREDLQRNLAALEAACAQLLPGRGVQRCVDAAEADKPAGGAVAAAREQLPKLREFVAAQELVTIPGNENALVDEAPPYNRANFAYINVPGPYDEGLPATYYVAPPDPKWSKREQAAYVPGKSRLLFVSAHEVWPGHFLQFLHANRNPSKLAALFVGYAFAEGWAHYSEELMWDAGLGDQQPAAHVAQLGQALLRDVRYLSAVGMHARGMTLEESEQMFLTQAYADAGTARQQAARGARDPAYLNYTLGKLQIRKLRTDWLAEQKVAGSALDTAARQALHRFHDGMLSYGGPPISMVRERMLSAKGDSL
ncbi:MAG: DUF885 domain-containing protein [Steroidobacteraceae bacterium]